MLTLSSLEALHVIEIEVEYEKHIYWVYSEGYKELFPILTMPGCRIVTIQDCMFVGHMCVQVYVYVYMCLCVYVCMCVCERLSAKRLLGMNLISMAVPFHTICSYLLPLRLAQSPPAFSFIRSRFVLFYFFLPRLLFDAVLICLFAV